MTTTICPSGLAGTQRKMRVRELAEMTESSSRGGTDGGMWRVMEAIWIETADPGPYPFLEPGANRIDIKRMVLGDAHHMLVAGRIVTHGRYHDIHYSCPGCRRPCVAEVDLVDDLPIRPLPEAAAKVVRAGGTFDARLLDGSKITYRLFTLGMEETIGKVRQQLERDVKAGRRKPIPKRDKADIFAAQTAFIEALGEDKSRDQKARLDYFWDLTVDEETCFDEQVSVNDCGYDDVIHAVCEHEDCLRRNTLQLPLDREFFRPSKIARRQKALLEAMAKEKAVTKGTPLLPLEEPTSPGED